MLETLAVVLIVLWLLGLLTSYTLGGLIHLLLVITLIAIILRLISGRRIERRPVSSRAGIPPPGPSLRHQEPP